MFELYFIANAAKSFLKINISKLKLQTYKLYINKYMIASTQVTNTEIFGFITALLFTLSSRKMLFINRKV